MSEPISTVEQHLVLVVLASTISFGVTEIVKPFVSFLGDRGRRHAVTRLMAILSGAAVGYTLGPSWLDVWFGAGAGVLNAWLVGGSSPSSRRRSRSVSMCMYRPETRPRRRARTATTRRSRETLQIHHSQHDRTSAHGDVPPARPRCCVSMDSRCDAAHGGAVSAVDHPDHYRAATGHEAIAVIEAWRLNFNLGNVVKYISRAGHKVDRLEDLQKALWYLSREVEHAKRDAGETHADR